MTTGQARPIWRQWYVVAGAAWLIRYAMLGRIPFLQGVPVWTTWFDQSRYLASAQALAQGDLSAASHWYPLGYAAAAAPFAWVMPRDPFFLLDLILFLLTCRAFQAVAGRLGIGRWAATWCFLATTIVQNGIAGAWIQPWTTTLSAAIIWWLIDRVLCVAERGSDRRLLGDLILVGALAAALPLVRPVDAVLSVTCLAIVAAILLRRRALSLRSVLAPAFSGAIVCGLYGLLHWAIYGLHVTPYMVRAADTGFVWHDLGWKAHILLIDPQPWYPGSRAIFEVLPWIVPGLAGLIALTVAGTPRERWIAALLLALTIPISAIMLTYADLQPPGLWYYGNVHYFKWVMPACGAGILLCRKLLQTARGRTVLSLTAIAMLVPLGIRVDPVPVTERQPARLLLYAGDIHRDPAESYFAPVTITDSRGTMRNVFDFHQLPDDGGARAIAISRPFARDPRRSDPGEPVFHTMQRPYARFGEKLSFLGL